MYAAQSGIGIHGDADVKEGVRVRVRVVPARRWLFRHGSTAQILLTDTSFASLILDGELWNRSPADYCRYQPEVLYQILLARLGEEVWERGYSSPYF